MLGGGKQISPRQNIRIGYLNTLKLFKANTISRRRLKILNCTIISSTQIFIEGLGKISTGNFYQVHRTIIPTTTIATRLTAVTLCSFYTLVVAASVNSESPVEALNEDFNNCIFTSKPQFSSQKPPSSVRQEHLVTFQVLSRRSPLLAKP